MLISTKDRVINSISYSHDGKQHDYKILKDTFASKHDWFKKFTLKVDLGYLGIKKDYNCAGIATPHKKIKLHPLTDSQKDENKKMASKRISVEHSIGGMCGALELLSR